MIGHLCHLLSKCCNLSFRLTCWTPPSFLLNLNYAASSAKIRTEEEQQNPDSLSKLGAGEYSCKRTDLHLNSMFPDFLIHQRKLRDKTSIACKSQSCNVSVSSFAAECLSYWMRNSGYNICISSLLPFQGNFYRIISLPRLFLYTIVR